MTDDPLLRTIIAALTPGRIERLGVAVSGGGDSVALLHLLAAWRAAGGPDLAAVTVDHGLRPEAAAEAEAVAVVCAGLGVPHTVLRWQWDRRGNLQDAARRARQRLIAEWAAGQGAGAVALGHTADDQAETVLLRLARGSGVDGLSGMAAERRAEGVLWLRPLLEVRRGALRDWLRTRGVGWAEDPSNDDPRFDRVKARQALAALAPLGLDVAGLADTAARMRMAREALAQTAQAAARGLGRIDAGDVVLASGFAGLPEETRLRIAAHALRWIGGGDYRPRLAALQGALAAAQGGKPATLAGCLLLPEAGGLRIAREPQAVAATTGLVGDLWDGRWRLEGPGPADCEVRALGAAGLALCPGWRETGRPHAGLAATPAVWRGANLVAAPLAGHPAGWRAELACGEEDFLHSLILD
ncbi:tRNA lysidine(34) synthetase TilS [Frigidibacter albus]|uniref:tRNA lysidine(34) synthetase TilS n=1 Tax=Frigidibacter albus TaxID=1465486 RepID=UPI00227AC7D1|nr:tRNA lysidine(34) synthetase TilS [Frigidibacter albus]